MTKREARKVVLRAAAQELRGDAFGERIGAPSDGGAITDEQRKIRAEIRRLADHLEWEADGRRDALR